ncbi:bifunctional 4-hydroxy-2-oxoglutarate aldolase/2-dehydro-3-deoxy-phosphogluconate aldolase [Acaryochloris sp. IP29b_bin.148]|uniref:bifunctional 4-hydroxy-2-oxoglutarate aldolase/2-dehydro-3-deoxy-phosphogluconate aldolase n=1 Tax=Acaryochloris sp. IP29b_bin.148 TaxID=2969218 RepID=UPI002625EECF|nr:bifunctional 4-hydroxy-2-oxoglutarate aldolase/2-dehydro-3-deoxy-phosphogluconate aldolase [Acaryochloris sp. IP29b_bin.148]
MRTRWLETVKHHRAIGVIRAPDWSLGLCMARAIAQAGMSLIEIAWNSDQPATLVTQLRQELPNCHIGVGTILTVNQLHLAVEAGAQFCFCPHVNVDLIQAALAAKVAIIPGALTPTEIMAAWHAGASSVKIFPVAQVGGSQYIQSLQGPIGHIPMIPTGGISLDNAPAMITAGAIGVGLSSFLFPKRALAMGNWLEVSYRAETLLTRLQTAHFSP